MSAFLGSSDSDAARPDSSAEKKRRPKRKPPPQKGIDKLWKAFVDKKPSKALSVLPFAQVPSPTSVERDNEILSAGFDYAAAECRGKVNKIIKECRRVNMRYRDQGFDLDWDLRMQMGNCLNSIGESEFDVTYSYWLSLMSTRTPKTVKRVHEIFDEPTFMENISASDIKQGGLGDCWLISSLSGLAATPDLVKKLCVAYDTKIGIYGFVFFRDGEWVYSIIDDKLYLKSPNWDHPSMQRRFLQNIDREDNEEVYRKTYQTGSKALFFATCKDENETWVPLLEKAYAKCHGDYSSLSGGFSGEGLEDLTGGVTTELLTSDIIDQDAFWETELSRVKEEFLFSCTTGLLEPGYGYRNGIAEAHAYMVLEARTLTKGEHAGTRLVLVRNPWGATRKGVWQGAFSDGSKEWTPEVQTELGHKFGHDSVFWITYKDFMRKFTQFDRTRLFSDPDWRCCQRFAGCEVPWKPQFDEKFTFNLTKSSPLILVLSQLDDRYFKGLEGQYDFKLHFRLHEMDNPDPQDYIVRSHGNYFMYRSVAVEIPELEEGQYLVFVSVTAIRRTGNPTVEEVIIRETKDRSENEKLAQVGLAYDIAHAKAAKHIQATTANRKNAAWNKASEHRMAYRKHAFEKKHLTKKLEKKKANKNKEKKKARAAERKARRDKREAEARSMWEAKEAERVKKEEIEEAEAKKKREEREAERQKREEERKQKKQEEAEERKKKEEEEKQQEEEEKKEEEEEAMKPKDKGVQTEVPEAKKESRGSQTEAERLFGEESDSDDACDTPAASPAATDKASLYSKDDLVIGEEDKDKETDDGSSKGDGDATETEGKGGQGAVEENAEGDTTDHFTDAEDKPAQTEEAGSSNGQGSEEVAFGEGKDSEDKKEEGSSKDSDVAESKDNDEKPSPGGGDSEQKTEEKDDQKGEKAEENAKTGEKNNKAEENKGKKEDETNEAKNETKDETKDEKKEEKKDEKAPETPAKEVRQPPKVKHSDTESDSSASPLSDWEELYSSDNMTKKPRREIGRYPSLAPDPASKICDKTHDSEEKESTGPDPWNAICIVGFRVYSKDEGLTLRVVDVEEEEGAGRKEEEAAGKPDLDSAVMNAAVGLKKGNGKKEDEKTEEGGGGEKTKEDEVKKDEGEKTEEKGKEETTDGKDAVDETKGDDVREGNEKKAENKTEEKTENKVEEKESEDKTEEKNIEEKKPEEKHVDDKDEPKAEKVVSQEANAALLYTDDDDDDAYVTSYEIL